MEYFQLGLRTNIHPVKNGLTDGFETVNTDPGPSAEHSWHKTSVGNDIMAFLSLSLSLSLSHARMQREREHNTKM